MTSREIAELVDCCHVEVVQSIERLAEPGVIDFPTGRMRRFAGAARSAIFGNTTADAE
jgi:phage regulator Rha-like protein